MATEEEDNQRTPGKDTWKRDLEKEMWSAGYNHSWMKMEAVAQNRAGCRDGWSSVACVHLERQVLNQVIQSKHHVICWPVLVNWTTHFILAVSETLLHGSRV